MPHHILVLLSFKIYFKIYLCNWPSTDCLLSINQLIIFLASVGFDTFHISSNSIMNISDSSAGVNFMNTFPYTNCRWKDYHRPRIKMIYFVFHICVLKLCTLPIICRYCCWNELNEHQDFSKCYKINWLVRIVIFEFNKDND